MMTTSQGRSTAMKRMTCAMAPLKSAVKESQGIPDRRAFLAVGLLRRGKADGQYLGVDAPAQVGVLAVERVDLHLYGSELLGHRDQLLDFQLPALHEFSEPIAMRRQQRQLAVGVCHGLGEILGVRAAGGDAAVLRGHLDQRVHSGGGEPHAHPPTRHAKLCVEGDVQQHTGELGARRTGGLNLLHPLRRADPSPVRSQPCARRPASRCGGWR